MTTALLIILLVSNLAALALLAALWRRSRAGELEPISQALEIIKRDQERVERAVREEIARNREDTQIGARQTREEIATSVLNLSETLQRQLASLTQSNEVRFDKIRETVDGRLRQM